MVIPTCIQFTKWKNAGLGVEHVQCDNTGENKLLETKSNGESYNLGLVFEYTARGTPQQNHLAELKLASIANRGRAMMNRAHIPLELRYHLFRYAATTATKLDMLVVVEIDGVKKMRCEHWCGKIPEFAKYLKVWGEAGTVTLKGKIHPKPKDKGVHCMFVGYSDDHDGDCYDMWDPNKKRIHQSRDVTWLKRMYFVKPIGDLSEARMLPIIPVVDDYLFVEDEEQDQLYYEDGANGTPGIDDVIPQANEEIEQAEEAEVEDHEDGDEIGDTSANIQDGTIEEVAERVGVRRSSRTPKRNVRFVETMTTMHDAFNNSYQNNYYDMITKIAKDDFEEGEICCVGAGLGGGFENTNELKVLTYDEAMDSKNRIKWEKAIDVEHDRFVKNNCMQIIMGGDMPEGAKIIDTTWVMKQKASGVFRPRCVAKGFQQKQWIHYDPQNISAPVTNDATIRITFVLMLMAGWSSYLLDINGAFLMGEFENNEQIYTPVPEGFEKYYPKGAYWLILKTIYGLKQAAKMFWKMLLKAMESMGFRKSWADPCLYFKWTDAGLVLWLSWIDDCLCVGEAEAVVKAKDDMLKRFDCDDIGEVNEYLGCKIDINKEEGSLRMTQPVLLQSYSDEFNLPETGRVSNIPAVAGSVLSPEVPEEEKVDDGTHSKYRSAVGKLLHNCRWTRPEIWNIVRELTRGVKGPSKAHVLSAGKCMKYCVDTPERGWFLKPNRKWDGSKEFQFVIKGRSDSDFAKCPTTRKSVSGWNVKLEDAPVIVKSGMQRSPTLSVTESELVAGVTCAQDMLFVKNILESIGCKVKLPMLLEIDNKGVVDLTHSFSVSGRTKHIQYRYLWLRDMQEQGMINVQWIKGEKNETDI